MEAGHLPTGAGRDIIFVCCMAFHCPLRWSVQPIRQIRQPEGVLPACVALRGLYSNCSHHYNIQSDTERTPGVFKFGRHNSTAGDGGQLPRCRLRHDRLLLDRVSG